MPSRARQRTARRPGPHRDGPAQPARRGRGVSRPPRDVASRPRPTHARPTQRFARVSGARPPPPPRRPALPALTPLPSASASPTATPDRTTSPLASSVPPHSPDAASAARPRPPASPVRARHSPASELASTPAARRMPRRGHRHRRASSDASAASGSRTTTQSADRPHPGAPERALHGAPAVRRVTARAASTVADIYYPSKAGPWPVIVTLHGRPRDPGDMAELAEALAAKGAVVFNVDYRGVRPRQQGLSAVDLRRRVRRPLRPPERQPIWRRPSPRGAGGPLHGRLRGRDGRPGWRHVPERRGQLQVDAGHEGVPAQWLRERGRGLRDPSRLSHRPGFLGGTYAADPERLEAGTLYTHIGRRIGRNHRLKVGIIFERQDPFMDIGHATHLRRGPGRRRATTPTSCCCAEARPTSTSWTPTGPSASRVSSSYGTSSPRATPRTDHRSPGAHHRPCVAGAQRVLAQQLVRRPLHLPPVDLAVADGHDPVPEPGHLLVHPGPVARHPWSATTCTGSDESSLVRSGGFEVGIGSRRASPRWSFRAPS